MITIKYGHSISKIEGALIPRVLEDLSYNLSYEVPNAERTDAYLETNWDGRKRLFHKGHRTFPTGLLYMVEDILKKHQISYTIVGRDYPDIVGDIDVENTMLRDYQLKAIVDAVDNGRGLIHLPTAAGKSHICVGIISLIGRRSLIVVHRKELADQFMEHCETFGLKAARLQGIKSMRLQHSKGWDSADAYVAMSQTLHSTRVKEPTVFYGLVQNIEVFIVDEIQRIGARTYYATMMEFDETPYRFGKAIAP